MVGSLGLRHVLRLEKSFLDPRCHAAKSFGTLGLDSGRLERPKKPDESSLGFRV